MNNDYKSPAFRKLLDSLQQQSWELELIISGFAIFGLFTAYHPILTEMLNAESNGQVFTFVINLVALIACSILIFNLLLHVVLRGVWIGALGLRYVSGDIDFEVLKYGAQFKNYLKKRIISFDRYIATLENYCSVLFALSFLTIFFVLGLTLMILAIALVGNFIIDNQDLPNWISNFVGIPLMVFLVVGMLLTFFDFISLGLLKRNKWVAKIYFPVYWVFSYITLSFLYRPLLYNFLDNKFGKRLIMMLTPIYIGILLLTGLEVRTSNYFNAELKSSAFIANNENYRDLITDTDDIPAQMTIQSKVIRAPYINVFIGYTEAIEDRVLGFNDSLKPEKDRRGLISNNINFSSNDWFDRIKNKDSIRKIYLKTFNDIYSFKIDTLNIPGNFILATDNKERVTFESYIPIKELPEGQHLLQLLRKERKKDTFVETVRVKIPFWYYKE
ncbi:Hypothetical protein I595_2254 [Croceitalea dokdonensis DOKDO 023]|uniref:Uncharacterized protein n=1 Tax=Croceitalea dokdonensis DOKDO 023 TaxID=1300341 RepID=A0A0P7AIZ1_9FLAO|nr:tetraspanin family protein [Croceitalea dokdonensis]KPM31759.1 Hypothetical protein I595_2254 [Croceitalea dokdonensis DOKDO 023]